MGGWEAGTVRVEQLTYSLTEANEVVSGDMEIAFAADVGSFNDGSYEFHLPPGAVIHTAELYLPNEERWERAETLGRREGQTAYDEIVEPRPDKDPLLLQRVGPDSYRVRVYPVVEHRALRVRIRYAHPLASGDRGRILWVPLAQARGALQPSVRHTRVTVTTGQGWQGASWQQTGDLGGLEQVDEWSDNTTSVTFVGGDIDHDIGLALFAPVSPAVLTALQYESPAAGVPRHLFVGWTPDFSAYPSVAAGARNVVFVVDLSGSMVGQKIAEAETAVIAALETLAPADWYGLVAFSGATELFREEMVGGADTAAAIAWVRTWRPQDYTDIGAGLAAGAKLGARSPAADVPVDLVLVTDGRPTAGPTTTDAILGAVQAVAAESGRTIRIFGCGIGSDVDQSLLVDLATATGGETTFALADQKIGEQLAALFDRVRSGGASQVEVRLESEAGATTQVFSWPRVFPGTPLYLGATDVHADAVTVSLAATTPDGVAITMHAALDLAGTATNTVNLAPPLYARALADQLERDIDQTLESPERVSAAVRLAKTYGVLSRYSSMLALESAAMYGRAGVDRIERDPAGIALSPVSASAIDEAQIGVADFGAPSDVAVGTEPATGCACAAASLPSLATLAGVGVLRRQWRKRRAGTNDSGGGAGGGRA